MSSCDCVCFLPHHFGREELNFELWKQQYLGDMKIIFLRNETKSISVRVTQFLVNSLFYTWTFIKSEFFWISSAWHKHIFCLSRNKLFQHDGILWQSWLVFTVFLFLAQRMSLQRYSERLKVYSTNFQTNRQSLLLNTVTVINCIQSDFPYCKRPQSEVTKKNWLLTLDNTGTNKINKNKVKWI